MIHHVKLPVSDIARSRAWYERVLGLKTTIEFTEDGVVRGIGLSRDDSPPQLALREDPERAKALAGFDPVALLMPTRDEVRATAACSTRRASRTAGSSPDIAVAPSSSACTTPTASRSASTRTDGGGAPSRS